MESNDVSKESKAYHKYILGIYSIEYMIEEAKMMSAINDIKRFMIVDGLDIDIDTYLNEFGTIRKEINKLEKSGNITIDIYQSSKNKIKKLLDQINDEFDSLYIVSLYFKKINELLNDKDSNIEEIEEVKEKLNEYVIWIRIIDEEEYQKICEKYGVIENKALIDLLAISEEHKMKK